MHIFKYCGRLLPALIAIAFALPANAQQEETNSVAPDSLIVNSASSKKGPKVSGVIKDASSNLPLSGISVSVIGYSATITDDKGRFSISVPNYESSVSISSTGYQTKEVPLRGRKSISVSLYEENFPSAYAVANLPERSVPLTRTSGATSVVNTSNSWNFSSESIDSYLQGRVAGLNVVRRSGTPGMGANLYLRGVSSINTSNQPLIVVDGMIYDTKSYGNSIIGGHVNNPLQQIDLKDISNITVIKDATAGVYGTKAANGVILITTNHAQELSTKIDFAAYSGFNFKPSNLPVLGADDYRIYLAEMLKSQGKSDQQIAASSIMKDDPASSNYYNFHNNTNWQNKVFDNSLNQNYYLKITGGDNIAKYALSLGYLKSNGVTDNTGLSKYTTRFNSDLNLSKKLTANANLSFAYGEQNFQSQGLSSTVNPIFSSLVKAPIFTANFRDTYGAASPNLAESDTLNVSNPVALIQNAKLTSKNYRFFGSIVFNYQFNKNLALSNQVGVTFDKVREIHFSPKKEWLMIP